MTNLYLKKISIEEIKRRQEVAQVLGEKIASLIERNRKLNNIVELLLWHGSLPLGRGGECYDIDYALFLQASTATDLLEAAELVSREVVSNCKEITWRNDLHYDGQRMFEAHTHWDPVDKDLPHIGVHLYRTEVQNELLNKFDWRSNQRPKAPFLRMLDSWQRYCFFYRHWIYEGVPLYDPKSIYEQMKNLGFSPTDWLISELREVLSCTLMEYRSSQEIPCTVSTSQTLALERVALWAYAIEGLPIGRWIRYASDIKEFKDEGTRHLLECVIKKDIKTAARIFEAVAESK